MQPVADDKQMVGREAGNALGIVGHELMHHLRGDLFLAFIVGLVEAAHTVALFLDGGLRLVYGKVVGGCELGILPGLTLLYMKIAAAVVGHGPHRDDYR